MSQDTDQPPKRLCVGRIADAHGIKGLIKIRLYDFDVSVLQEADEIFTSESSNTPIPLTIKSSTGKFYLAEIDGVNDRNASEALKGTELYVSADLVPEDDVLRHAILGFDVVDEEGKAAGSVLGIANFGASDLIEIKPVNGHAYYLPWSDDFVLKINEDKRQMIIRPMEIV